MDVVNEAKKLEEEAKSGHLEEVSQELHKMRPDDRKAVAKQIEADQKAHPTAALPSLDFYDTGDLKSTDRSMDESTTVHTTYDKATGNRRSEDYKSADGSSSHWEYNTQTGMSKSGEYHYADGTSSHNEHDDKTRKNWSVETDAAGRVTEAKGTDGTARSFHYDENGKLDSISGRLGHWERTTADGKDVWHNKDTGADWKGSFNVDSTGNLIYKSDEGKVWSFDRDGGEKRLPAVDLVSKGDHGETLHKNESGQITQVLDQRGTTYQFKYDNNGDLTSAKITGSDGESGSWRRQSDGEWQSYGNDGKPSNLRLKGGNWQVDAQGSMYHSGGEIIPLPEKSRR
jgi:YD repeat-containing protein